MRYKIKMKRVAFSEFEEAKLTFTFKGTSSQTVALLDVIRNALSKLELNDNVEGTKTVVLNG